MNIKSLAVSRLPVLIFCSVLVMNAVPLSPEVSRFKLNLDEKKLLAGELQSFVKEYAVEGEGVKKRVIGVILLNAPVEKVWDVIADWEKVATYLPSLDYYKIRHRIEPAGPEYSTRFLIEGKLSVSFLSFIYNLDVSFNKKTWSQSWKMIQKEGLAEWKSRGVVLSETSGSIKNIEGFSYLEPYGDGSKTVYYYVPIVEVSVPVPAFIERALSKSSLNEYMEGLSRCFK